ncbi:hypothetical protein [Natrinema sp. SYSU A 869]|uniref:hypothetical protein n=1 Tax=Natrinema sp. SYSU A 869 TaxID=2871694 RepID=UPI001CA3D7E8
MVGQQDSVSTAAFLVVHGGCLPSVIVVVLSRRVSPNVDDAPGRRSSSLLFEYPVSPIEHVRRLDSETSNSSAV